MDLLNQINVHDLQLSQTPHHSTMNTPSLELVVPSLSGTSATVIVPAERHGLPQELYDHILDHLHDDNDTMRQCSLVCQAWLSTSSLHLFRCLLWPPCSHRQNYICAEELGELASLSHLPTVLLRSSRIRYAVRTLRLTPHAKCSACELAYVHELLAHSIVLDTIKLLPNLQHLHLRDARLEYEASIDVKGPFPLRTLRLYEHLEAALGFLQSFSHLDKLTLEICPSFERYLYPRTAIVREPAQRRVTVDALEIIGYNAPHILAQLQSLFDCNSIRGLVMSTRLSDHFISFAQAMPHLETLAYCVDSKSTPTFLAHLPLQSVIIEADFFFFHSTRPSAISSDWDIAMRDLELLVTTQNLRRIGLIMRLGHGFKYGDDVPGPEVHELILKVYLATFLQDQNWGRLESVVARLPALEIISIGVKYWQEQDPAHAVAVVRDVALEALSSQTMAKVEVVQV